MRKLPEPINGAELYLAAILDELRIISAVVGGGSPETRFAQTAAEKQAAEVLAGRAPTKRTRARTPR